jgi:hypothetical protein
MRVFQTLSFITGEKLNLLEVLCLCYAEQAFRLEKCILDKKVDFVD